MVLGYTTCLVNQGSLVQSRASPVSRHQLHMTIDVDVMLNTFKHTLRDGAIFWQKRQNLNKLPSSSSIVRV